LKILYAKALAKDLEAVSRHSDIKKKISNLIETLKAIDSLREMQHIKKIEGYDC